MTATGLDTPIRFAAPLRGRYAAWLSSRTLKPLMQRAMRRRFRAADRVKVLVVYEDNRISFSHVFPFLYYQGELEARYGAAVRLVERSAFEADPARFAGADIALFECWFDIAPDAAARLVAALKSLNPAIRLSFVDSFAPKDLRLGAVFDDSIEFYLKKSLYVDRSRYFEVLQGDTNLMDYYSRLFDIPQAPVDWGTPQGLVDKLRLCPGFAAAPGLLERFDRARWRHAPREIDIHARLASQGAPWYRSMRAAGLDALRAIPGRRVAMEGRVSHRAFMRELETSKCCFSPFGYGELCWRDIEAFAAGAVLIKPDMSHLETRPALFEAGVTYVPVAWDYSDLRERVEEILSDDARRQAIAGAAFERVARYLENACFVDDMAFLFR
jgi:hypothetical protein